MRSLVAGDPQPQRPQPGGAGAPRRACPARSSTSICAASASRAPTRSRGSPRPAASSSTLTRAEPPVDAERAGKILVQVLELAEALPVPAPGRAWLSRVCRTASPKGRRDERAGRKAVRDPRLRSQRPGSPMLSAARSHLPTASRSHGDPRSRRQHLRRRRRGRDGARVLPDGRQGSEEDIATGRARRAGAAGLGRRPRRRLPQQPAAARRRRRAVVWVPLEGRDVPVLDCASLAIFKAFFDRTKDWADLEAIAQATPEDIEEAAATIAELVGEDDPGLSATPPLTLLDPRPGPG